DAAAANVEQAFADQARAARLRPRQTAVSEFGLPLTGGDAATGPAAGEATPEDAMDGEAMDGDGAAGDGIGGGGDGEGPDGIGGDGATALATPTASATPAWLRGEGPYGELRPALFFSDLHCNVGMAQVMGAAARALGAELVLDGGDTTMDGTAVERYCVDQIAAAIPEEAAWVAVIGNHDSVQTADQEAAAGALVLDGKVETVAGLRILGDADPTHTEVALGTSQRDQESLADVAERLADTACEDGPIDFLLVHQPAMAQVPLASGCVPAALTGHMHTRSNPKVVGGGVFYTQASTGRDNAETTNLGPLGSPAEMTILLFDSDGRIAAWQLLTVNPDASAKLSAIKAWPAAPGPDPASERK
ncbi:MAG: metallophosphoesterase, partial [Bifidobacteriaceae bacterium]|nr:metallophosphoesterase [Bifidobacteriaceae bacterium]